MYNIKVSLLSDPSTFIKCCSITQGIENINTNSLNLYKKMLKAEHSPIRVIQIMIELINIPYYVSVQIVRHNIGVLHFVRSQRNTAINPVPYKRDNAPQNSPVNHILILNPQSLINISRKRLCQKADSETFKIWKMVKEKIKQHDNEYINSIAEYMVPECVYRSKCSEINTCGYFKSLN